VSLAFMTISPTDTTRNLGLDVVRSIAILLVMGCHYGNTFLFWLGVQDPQRYGAAPGFYGVELFFVLSGFLIGRILLNIATTRPTGEQLLVFLTRRWLRTLPLYILWVGILWAFVPFTHVSTDYIVRYVTLTQNFFWRMPNDNFFPVSWSLTVEEWFYLFFASLMVLSAACLRHRAAIWIPIATFLVVPTILRYLVPESGPLAGDMRTVMFLRLDAIAYGTVVAAVSLLHPGWLRQPRLLLALGVALIVAAWENLLYLPHHLASVLTFNLSSIGLALCLPAAIRLRQAPRWFVRIARAISAQSYGLYIMHLTFIDLTFRARGQWPWLTVPAAMAISLGAPVVLSWLSFRYFETPILNLRPSQARTQMFLPGDQPVSEVASRSSSADSQFAPLRVR
jgi:peptidoglycan/LPS O-acetylase OafA/YrhL